MALLQSVPPFSVNTKLRIPAFGSFIRQIIHSTDQTSNMDDETTTTVTTSTTQISEQAWKISQLVINIICLVVAVVEYVVHLDMINVIASVGYDVKSVRILFLLIISATTMASAVVLCMHQGGSITPVQEAIYYSICGGFLGIGFIAFGVRYYQSWTIGYCNSFSVPTIMWAIIGAVLYTIRAVKTFKRK